MSQRSAYASCALIDMHVVFSGNVECQVLRLGVEGVERGDADRGWRDAAPHPRDGRSAPPAIFCIISLKLSL